MAQHNGPKTLTTSRTYEVRCGGKLFRVLQTPTAWFWEQNNAFIRLDRHGFEILGCKVHTIFADDEELDASIMKIPDQEAWQAVVVTPDEQELISAGRDPWVAAIRLLFNGKGMLQQCGNC
jgi:hypothetical protein